MTFQIMLFNQYKLVSGYKYSLMFYQINLISDDRIIINKLTPG